MYIAIYFVAIVLFCGCLLLFFFNSHKKQNQRLAKLQKESAVDVSSDIQKVAAEPLEKLDENQKANIAVAADKGEKQTKELADFEDFSLDDEKEKAKPKNSFATVGGKNFNRLFDFDEDEKDVDENDFLDDDEIARYEKTLRDSLKFDMNEELDNFNKMNAKFNNESDFASRMSFDDENFGMKSRFDGGSHFGMKSSFNKVNGFDFDSLKGKTQTEIEQMIKNLDPKLQEFILADVLARKNWEE